MKVKRVYKWLKVGAAVGSQAFWKSGSMSGTGTVGFISMTAITLPSLSNWTLKSITLDVLMDGTGTVNASIGLRRTQGSSDQVTFNFSRSSAWQYPSVTDATKLAAVKSTGILGGSVYTSIGGGGTTAGWSVKQVKLEYEGPAESTVTAGNIIYTTDATKAGISVSQYSKINASDTGFTAGNIIKASDWNSKTFTITTENNYTG